VSNEPPAAAPGPRILDDDPLAMRALAHPTRIRLIEELTLRGPMTATQAAAYVGESPSSCSFHLRTLAKYGFVEEAPGGTGRQRPWRAVSIGHRWSSGPGTEASARAASDTLSAQVWRRDDELLAEHLARRDELPDDWTQAVVHSNFGSWMTPDELAAMGAELLAMWQPYLDRLRDPSNRPPGSRLVHMSVHGFPRADGTPNAADRNEVHNDAPAGGDHEDGDSDA
jgi:DNA-binding transcriptional ArsR family regulator